MWLVFLLIIVTIGILLAKIEIVLYSVDITEKCMDFNLILYLKLFYFFKILKVRFNRHGLKIINKKIEYKELMSKRDFKRFNRQSFEIFKRFNINFNKVNFRLKIGLVDMALTNIVIVVFSSVFPNLVKNKVKRKNLNYKIFPDYKNFCVKLDGRISVSIKLLSLIKLYLKNIKLENEHNKNKNYRVKESY